MNNKFQNKYRIPSARLQTWDYANNGAYFITICTKNREQYFGKIENNEMQLSEIGKFAEEFWLEIPNQFSFIELGNFIVMPNHIHGILIINNLVETRFIASNLTDIPIQFIASNQIDKIQENNSQLIKSNTGGITGEKNPMFYDNISRIVRWYKGRCSFEIRKLNLHFEWQPRFHDHIIQNSNSFEIIQNYIQENPSNWEKDKFY
jgi:putative transposase